jgi:hypothetical protein
VKSPSKHRTNGSFIVPHVESYSWGKKCPRIRLEPAPCDAAVTAPRKLVRATASCIDLSAISESFHCSHVSSPVLLLVKRKMGMRAVFTEIRVDLTGHFRALRTG